VKFPPGKCLSLLRVRAFKSRMFRSRTRSLSRLPAGVAAARAAEKSVGLDVDDRGTGLNVDMGLTRLAENNSPDK
jgi:hypothetical protein